MTRTFHCKSAVPRGIVKAFSTEHTSLIKNATYIKTTYKERLALSRYGVIKEFPNKDVFLPKSLPLERKSMHNNAPALQGKFNKMFNPPNRRRGLLHEHSILFLGPPSKITIWPAAAVAAPFARWKMIRGALDVTPFGHRGPNMER